MSRDLPIGTTAARPHLLVLHRRESTHAFKFLVLKLQSCYRLTPPPVHDYKYTCTYADDLLVHLGVYQRVMKLVRDELYGMRF